MNDNSIEDIEDINIIEAIKGDIMGFINGGVMGHIEDGNRMGVGDYRIIVALGAYNNMGTMLNDSSVELGVCRVTIPSIQHSCLWAQQVWRNFNRIPRLHTSGILSILFFSHAL